MGGQIRAVERLAPGGLEHQRGPPRSRTSSKSGLADAPCKSSDLGLFSVALQFEPGKPVKSSLRAREISVRSGQESILNDHRRSSSEVPNEPSIDIAGELAPSLATQQTRSLA